MYARATQGHNISFVREARLVVLLTTHEELKATTIAVWHATSEKSAASNLQQGLRSFPEVARATAVATLCVFWCASRRRRWGGQP